VRRVGEQQRRGERRQRGVVEEQQQAEHEQRLAGQWTSWDDAGSASAGSPAAFGARNRGTMPQRRGPGNPTTLDTQTLYA
jgi:hypothetical protein